ncbi:unnamed protein product [Heligmosomoides polygyrus]|uniref:DUF1767 domain-containing protein n=1 Tax=Heligmosomoides polygyrus TaxID=6339 RepID=A0A3P8CPE0_HELPZ|nr:unnamed protein product [Heligmosomoides polygyrus]
MGMIEEELVRAEVHLQDIKNQDPAAASSGVSGGIIGAIRKTSDAFLHSIHLIPAAPQQEQAQTNMPSMPATEESAAQVNSSYRKSEECQTLSTSGKVLGRFTDSKLWEEHLQNLYLLWYESYCLVSLPAVKCTGITKYIEEAHISEYRGRDTATWAGGNGQDRDKDNQKDAEVRGAPRTMSMIDVWDRVVVDIKVVNGQGRAQEVPRNLWSYRRLETLHLQECALTDEDIAGVEHVNRRVKYCLDLPRRRVRPDNEAMELPVTLCVVKELLVDVQSLVARKCVGSARELCPKISRLNYSDVNIEDEGIGEGLQEEGAEYDGEGQMESDGDRGSEDEGDGAAAMDTDDEEPRP